MKLGAFHICLVLLGMFLFMDGLMTYEKTESLSIIMCLVGVIIWTIYVSAGIEYFWKKESKQ